MLIKDLKTKLENENPRSAWGKGVKEYAIELLEDFENDYDFVGSPADKKALLNGADSWSQYSYGGCSLIYNEDIAERLCSPSELKKTKNGTNRPSKYEEWLDVQARALNQAASRVIIAAGKSKTTVSRLGR